MVSFEDDFLLSIVLNVPQHIAFKHYIQMFNSVTSLIHYFEIFSIKWNNELHEKVKNLPVFKYKILLNLGYFKIKMNDKTTEFRTEEKHTMFERRMRNSEY